MTTRKLSRLVSQGCLNQYNHFSKTYFDRPLLLFMRIDANVSKEILDDFTSRRSFWNSTNGNGEKKLKDTISDAEKLIGYPTSFMSFRHLVDDEPVNFIVLAKKLVGSGHPLLTTARDLLSQDPYNTKNLGGLWVLLVSKAVDFPDPLQETSKDCIDQRQRTLAETAELINTAHLIHRSMTQLQTETFNESLSGTTLSLGNKLSVLGGDYLMAKACLELSKLPNTDVVEYMAQAIGDISEAGILEDISEDIQTWGLTDWESYVYLSKGSLMAHSLMGAVALVGHPKEIQKTAFKLGRTLELALQICKDIELFHDRMSCMHHYNVLVWLGLNRSKQHYDVEVINKCYQDFRSSPTDLLTNNRLRDVLQQDVPDLRDQANELVARYVTESSQYVDTFSETEAKAALKQILNSIKDHR